jgi:WD40 repeat protein
MMGSWDKKMPDRLDDVWVDIDKDKQVGVLEFRILAPRPEIIRFRPDVDAKQVRGVPVSSEGGRFLVLEMKDSKLRFWDVLHRREYARPFEHPVGWNLTGLSPAGRFVVLTGESRAEKKESEVESLERTPFRVHEVKSGKVVLNGTASGFGGLLGLDDHWVFWQNEEGKVCVGDLDEGEEVGTFGREGDMVVSAAVSPDHRYGVTVGYTAAAWRELHKWWSQQKSEEPPPVPAVLRVWDLVRKVEQGWHQIEGVLPFPLTATFSPDGRMLAVGGVVPGKLLPRVILLDLHGCRRRASFQLPPTMMGRIMMSLRFTPDGKSLYAVCAVPGVLWRTDEPTGVVLWDVKKLRERAAFDAGRCYTWAVCPDALLFATGDTDGKLKLWDMRSGQQRLSLQAHDKLLFHLAFSEDGKTLTSIDSQGLLKVWDGGPGDSTP